MSPSSPATPGTLIYRHRLPVRVMHWINVLCVFVLLGSGLNIFNAHPALYWGKSSHFDTPLMEITDTEAQGKARGVLRIGGAEFDTTGVLGLSRVGDDTEYSGRAFPSWATIPSRQWLAMARFWHLFFAWIFVVNGAAYVLYSLFSGHLRRDLVPSRNELKGIGGSIKDHLLLRHVGGDTPTRYNVLQSLAYLGMVLVVLPLIVVGGWALSPMMDAFIPGWVDLLGGRQGLRTLHFIGATLLVAFVLVHVFEVIVTGLANNLRSIVTGWWRVPK